MVKERRPLVVARITTRVMTTTAVPAVCQMKPRVAVVMMLLLKSPKKPKTYKILASQPKVELTQLVLKFQPRPHKGPRKMG